MNPRFQSHLSLKYYTTVHIGGVAPWAFFPADKDAVEEVFSIIKHRLKVPYFVLGRGSNVVIQDQNLQKAAVLTHYLNGIKVEGESVIVGAGVPMSFLSRSVLSQYQLSGLEFLCGLPGSIGGGVLMNARVFSKEIADFVEWVEVYDVKEEKFHKILQKDCAYGYKTSIFQKEPYFIFRIALRLQKVDDIIPYVHMGEENYKMRIEKHHFTYPSCGSFYKNNRDFGKPTGVLLDELALKDLRVGGAKISEYHANFFVNPEGTATYQDMLGLKQAVDKMAKDKGYSLSPEVHFIS